MRSDADGLNARGFRGRARASFLMFEGGADEGGEERVGFERFGFELGVELAAEKPRMIGGFDNLDVVFVGSTTGD